MLAAVALAYLAAGPLGAAICGVLAVVIALVLWTPLRGWLGIKPPAKNVPAGDRLRTGVVVADDSSDISVEDSDGYGVPVVGAQRSSNVRVARSRSWNR